MYKSLIASALLLLFLVSSCSPYRKLTFVKSPAYQKKRVAENIDRYDVIVHKSDSLFLLKNPTVENEVLSGTLESVENPEVFVAVDIEDREISEEEKNDLHVFVKDTVDGFTSGSEVNIEETSVRKTEMYGKSKSGVAGVALTVFLIIGGAFLLLLIILIVAIVVAVNDSSGGSSSGGSDSGGSDSGGSDSGCYIATMAYGSYDAPKVLVLRQFRDRFLQKFGLGRSFIRWYYANSPGFVAQHQSKQWLHKTLRAGLNIFVFILQPFFKVK